MKDKNHRIENKKVELIIFLIIFCAYIFSSIFIIFQNKANEIVYIFLAIIIVLLFALRNLIILKPINKLQWLTHILPVFELIIINYIFFTTNFDIIEFLFLIFVASIIVCYPVIYSLVYAFLGYAIYYILNIMRTPLFINEIEISTIIINIINYTFLIAAMVFAKNQIKKSELTKKLMRELQEKTIELEQVAIFKERNRIAGEMHDTVGHTITTTFVELEACKMLFKSNPSKAYEKLLLASDQLKISLVQLRNTVKQINKGDKILEFVPLINALASQVKKHTGVNVEVELHCDNLLIPLQEKVIYSTIQEAITNAIKHGYCTEILVILSQTEKLILLTIIDNGLGAQQIKYGFGLDTMNNRINGLGGTLEVTCRANKGCTLVVKLPKNTA